MQAWQEDGDSDFQFVQLSGGGTFHLELGAQGETQQAGGGER